MEEVKAAKAHSKQVIVLWVPAQRGDVLVLAPLGIKLPQRK